MKHELEKRGSGTYVDLTNKEYPPRDEQNHGEESGEQHKRGAEQLESGEDSGMESAFAERNVRARNELTAGLGSDTVAAHEAQIPSEAVLHASEAISHEHGQVHVNDESVMGDDYSPSIGMTPSNSVAEPSEEPGVVGENHAGGDHENQYGPVRTTELTRALRNNVGLLDQGRPRGGPYVRENGNENGNDDVLMVEKRRGRKFWNMSCQDVIRKS